MIVESSENLNGVLLEHLTANSFKNVPPWSIHHVLNNDTKISAFANQQTIKLSKTIAALVCACHTPKQQRLGGQSSQQAL